MNDKLKNIPYWITENTVNEIKISEDILKTLTLQDGMYKVIKLIKEYDDYIIYELEQLGTVKLTNWDGSEYLNCFKLDCNGNEIDLNIILKPRTFIRTNQELYVSDEPIYFYCK